MKAYFILGDVVENILGLVIRVHKATVWLSMFMSAVLVFMLFIGLRSHWLILVAMSASFFAGANIASYYFLKKLKSY